MIEAFPMGEALGTDIASCKGIWVSLDFSYSPLIDMDQ
jgi:hypothetical protein